MDYSVLCGSPLFKGLNNEGIDLILSVVPHRIRKFRSGSLIAQCGDKVESLMIVFNGVVKGEMIDYSGRVIKIEDIPAPGAIASAFIFGQRNQFPVNVICLSDTELLVIDKSDFLRLLMANDTILVNFLDMISNRSQFLSEKIKFLNFKTIKEKLAQYILQKAGADGFNVKLEITQTDMADFFGVARPSVARALKEMEERGLIEAKGKDIKVLDKRGLNELTAG
jgi:CRP/FNR family transcriptional regulator, dissimilatory nitrate respiration regulator